LSRHESREFDRLAALQRLVTETDWLMEVLCTSRDVITERGLASPVVGAWCVAAGAVRSVVWNHLHGLEATAPSDIDLVHFSPQAPPEFDAEMTTLLAAQVPKFRWEVVNQVCAHRFARNRDATPFVSLEHAMACWPETATAVGVALTRDGQLGVVAPHGLADLFDLVLRRSPSLRDPEVFEERVVAKRFRERWPLLRVV
jgi:hypothetical protein